MLDWIIEGIRTIIWGLTSACLTLMDVCYSIVVDIASADFLRDSTVWNWYTILMLLLGSLVIIRSCSVYFKLAFDEEFAEKVSGFNLIQNLIKIALVVAFLPMFLNFVGEVSTWGIKNLDVVVGTASNQKPSTLVITSFMNTENGEYNKDGEWIAGEKVTYTMDDVDINEDSDKEDEDYKYFDSITTLFLVAFIGVAAAVLLIMNAVQIGGRMYSIVVKLLVAPIPISSLIVPGDETFTMWRKMLLSDYLLNYLQTLMLTVVMILSGSKILQDMSMWVQIISLIAGFFMVLKGVPELSKIVGGDTSQGGMLQQIASLRQGTAGLAHAGGSALSFGASALSTASKAPGAIARGAGFMSDKMGINFMSDMKKAAKGSESGFMGGTKTKDGQGKYSSSGYEKQEASIEGSERRPDTMQAGYQGDGSLGNDVGSSSFGTSDFTAQGTTPQGSGYSSEASNSSFASSDGGGHMYQQKMSQIKATQQVRNQSSPDLTRKSKRDVNYHAGSPEITKGRK